MDVYVFLCNFKIYAPYVSTKIQYIIFKWESLFLFLVEMNLKEGRSSKTFIPKSIIFAYYVNKVFSFLFFQEETVISQPFQLLAPPLSLLFIFMHKSPMNKKQMFLNRREFAALRVFSSSQVDH